MIKYLLVVLLGIFSSGLLTINAQDDVQCVLACYPKEEAWLNSFAGHSVTATDYYTYWCSADAIKLWTDWVVCLKDTCPNLGITNEDWNSYVTGCAEYGVTVYIPPPSTPSGGSTGTIINPPVINPPVTTPTIQTCENNCGPLLNTWTNSIATTANDTLCGASWDVVKACVAKDCPSTGFGSIKTGLDAAVVTCQEKGIPITYSASTGGSNQNPSTPIQGGANSNVNFSGLLLIIGSLFASVAILFA
jgi:hypothetical protein